MTDSGQHRARKRFGQNFLVDETIIGRIIAAIAPVPGEHMIEIGPGQEALTGPLLAAGVDLTVVEIDRDLAGRLRLRHPELAIIQDDALRVDFSALAGGRPYRLIGNLPYNISTPLLFHLLAQDQPPREMVFMLQKEVVERMSAGPGSGTYGRLGLMCQARAEVDLLLHVPPGAFAPRPKVDSAVVRLRPRAEPLVPDALAPDFDRVVREAFSKRRKTLRNSLRNVLTAEAIAGAGIDPGQRAEQISLADFLSLAQALHEDVAGAAGKDPDPAG